MFIITNFFTLIFGIWMAYKISKSSGALMAVLCFFVFPVAVIPLVQNWGDGENDIRWPFFLTLGCSALSMWSMLSWAKEIQEQSTSFLTLLPMYA